MKKSRYKIKPFNLSADYYIDDNALFVVECLLKGQYNDTSYATLLAVPAEWTSVDFFRFLITLDEKYSLEFKSLKLLLSFYDTLEEGLFSGRGVEYVTRFLEDEMFETESVVVDKFLKETRFFIKDVRDILLKGMATDHISLNDLKVLLDNLNTVNFKGLFGDDISYLEEFIEVVKVFISSLNCTVSFKKNARLRIKTDLESYIEKFTKDELYGSGSFLLEAGSFKYSTNIYSFSYHKKLLFEELQKDFERYAHKFFKLTDFVHKHDILRESARPLGDTRKAYEERQFLFTHILKSFELNGAIFVQTYFVNSEDWTAVELGCFLNIKDLDLISKVSESTLISEETSIKYSIDTEDGDLVIGDKKIHFSRKNTNQYRALKIIIEKNKDNKIEYQEIDEALSLGADTEMYSTKKIEGYITAIHTKFQASGINDFFQNRSQNDLVTINPKFSRKA